MQIIENQVITVAESLLFRSYSVLVENVLSFVDYVFNQRLMRTDSA